MQSALGESLQAEIDVTSMTAEEAANLRIRVAPPEAYRAADVEYNPVLPSTRATLQRRPDGRPYLRLTSDRGVQEPFVDVILEISWATGRLVREYTLLFDPPTWRARRPPGPAAPAAPASPAPRRRPRRRRRQPRPRPRRAQREPPRASRAARAPARPAPAAKERKPPRHRARQPRPARARAPPVPASTSTASVRRHAVAHRGRTQRPGVSLDQMLVALFRANPQAFIGNNMNRLKAGVVLAVPTAEARQGVTPAEARKTILAQSADFGAYRQRLAGTTPTPPGRAEPRQASGKVQAAVDDKKAAAPTPDKLTLSKGTATAKPGSRGQDRQGEGEEGCRRAGRRACEERRAT